MTRMHTNVGEIWTGCMNVSFNTVGRTPPEAVFLLEVGEGCVCGEVGGWGRERALG